MNERRVGAVKPSMKSNLVRVDVSFASFLCAKEKEDKKGLFLCPKEKMWLKSVKNTL
jgi:hypothetical protein